MTEHGGYWPPINGIISKRRPDGLCPECGQPLDDSGGVRFEPDWSVWNKRIVLTTCKHGGPG